MPELTVVLKKGKEKPILGRHPWVYSGAIDLIDEDFKDGDIVRVVSSQRYFLGRGILSARTDIAVRMLTACEEPIDKNFFKRRLMRAAQLRTDWLSDKTNAYRLVNAEGDFLPGLIIDRYGDYFVIQSLFAGLEKWSSVFVELLDELFKPKGIYSKYYSQQAQSVDSRKEPRCLAGEECPNYVEIRENGRTFIVDIRGGQKTGFFLDQRASRELAGKICRGKKVLNVFAYTGGFSVYAACGGASQVCSIEASESALHTAEENFRRNNLDPANFQFVKGDAFEEFRKMDEKFDVIILDPPAFAKGKNQIMRASRGYKDINLQAMNHLESGGMLMSFSCSSYISRDFFQKILFGAAKDSGRDVQFIGRLSHAVDHPVSVFHPEGDYLKGFVCRVQ